MGKGIFVNCINLKKIIVDSQNEYYDSRGNCNAIIECKTNTLIAGCSSTNIPISVFCIGSKSFYRCRFTSPITIPENVLSIRQEAFYECSNLQKV